MKVLSGQSLVNELRRLSDSISNRLWIAVPYIGGLTSLRKILGKEWFDNPSVSVKVITDLSDIKNVNTETVQLLHERGQVKTLTGLHAKIYVIDNACLITSANLTNTAFSKRHEIGVLFENEQSNEVVELFKTWWALSENLKPEVLTHVVTIKQSSKEENGVSLPVLWSLPSDPGSFMKNLSKRFLNYDRLLADYQDFSQKYSSIQRLWDDKPLYFEIDGLFNYLYHDAPNTPSKEYAKKQPRTLTEKQQIAEITKWALNYRDWNNKKKSAEWGEDDIERRMRNSETIKKYLSPAKVNTLTKENLQEIFRCLNSLNSYPINRTKILNNNSIEVTRQALDNLVNGNGQLAARMDFCNKIKNLGSSSMNEIIGFAYPDKYPLINKNSNSGLRFFGYQIKAYS